MLLKVLPILAILSIITACAPASKSDSSSQEVTDRNESLAEISPLLGTYQGNLVSPGDGSQSYPIEIQIFMADVPSGVNENGQPKMTRVPRALYKRLDYPGERSLWRSLLVRSYKNGEIVLATDANVAPSSHLNINAHISGNTIAGSANNLNLGVLGDIRVTKVSN